MSVNRLPGAQVIRPRNWVKLWVSWLTTPAHLELSEGAFGLGPLLLLLATWDGEYESGGWLLTEAGRPMSREALARATHRTVARLNSQLAELERCGTLKRREDGALGFPKFGHWQEAVSAKRTRVYRDKLRHRDKGCDAPCDAQTVDGRRETEEQEQVSTPTGVSPPNSAGAEPGGQGGGQVLTHPTADPSAGTVASQRKRAAAELWAWHEGERTRRLLAGQHQARQATDKFLGPVLRLQAHVRKAYDCDEAEAWRRVREYREARLDETERGLREGHPEAAKWRGWAAGEAAWSSKGFDYLGEREPDPKAAKAAADAEYQAEVRRLKDLRRQQGGSNA